MLWRNIYIYMFNGYFISQMKEATTGRRRKHATNEELWDHNTMVVVVWAIENLTYRRHNEWEMIDVCEPDNDASLRLIPLEEDYWVFVHDDSDRCNQCVLFDEKSNQQKQSMTMWFVFAAGRLSTKQYCRQSYAIVLPVVENFWFVVSFRDYW